MKPDIALFVHSFAGGGAERVAVVLANELASRGHAVDFVVKRADGPYRTRVVSNVNVVDLDCELRYLPWAFRRYLKARNPRRVISSMTGFNLIAGLLIHEPGKRLLVTEHNSLNHRSWSFLDWQRLSTPLIKPVYRRAMAAVAVSSGIARELLERGVPDDVVRFIPNPIDPDLRNALVSKPILDDSPIVVGVGRLVEQKDFVTLIEAFEIVQRDQDVRLLILGEGPERQRLEDLAASLGLSNKIEMPGFIDNPWPLMAQASVFALSSRWEGWPNVLAEALALGLPVVSTDCPTGPNEILDNGKYGLLVPIQDPPALAAAIAQTLQDPPPSTQLKQRAEKWSVETITDQYLQALNLQPTP